MGPKSSLLWGAATACAAVILGAFGAHALSSHLTSSGRVDTYELAVRYQFYHALALLITGCLMKFSSQKLLRFAALCFVIGIILFSGTLYVLCFTGYKVLGAVTPLGGMMLITAWVLLFVGVYREKTVAP